MSTVTLDQAQRRLPELIESLSTEGDLLILGTDGPIAKLSSFSPSRSRPSLRDLQPLSVGGLLRAYPSPDDDLLGEMSPSRT